MDIYVILEDSKAKETVRTNEAGARAISRALSRVVVPLPTDTPVCLGDTYCNGLWFRNGERVLTYREADAKRYEEELSSTLADAANIVEQLYQSDMDYIIGG